MRSAKRPKSARAYRRHAAIREPYDVVLIVCEGTKTEPAYLSALIRANGLSSVNIRVVRPPRHDPTGLVDFAISELKKDTILTRAYCVFDRDGHATYGAALRKVRQSPLGKAKRLFVITSKPCFEVWLLLHYRYAAAPYTAVGGSSACDAVLRELLRYFVGYTKGRATIFAELADLKNTAQTNADRLEAHNFGTNSDNPKTKMHRLTRYLENLRR